MSLIKMRNIGREMERKLKFIGITTAEELKDVGSKEAFHRLKVAYPQVCLVHLYVLQGAIDDVEYYKLSAEMKADLKVLSDQLK